MNGYSWDTDLLDKICNCFSKIYFCIVSVIWTYNPSSSICSITECPDPCFVLMAAFLIISSLMYANMIHCHKLGTLLKKALVQVFSCEFCKTFESTLSTMRTTWKGGEIHPKCKAKRKVEGFYRNESKTCRFKKVSFLFKGGFPSRSPASSASYKIKKGTCLFIRDMINFDVICFICIALNRVAMVNQWVSKIHDYQNFS